MMLVKFICLFLPWNLKRFLLCRLLNYDLHKQAYIGFSWFYPRKLTMKSQAKVGHFNVAIHLDEIKLEECTIIERGNWITGFSTQKKSQHFEHQVNKRISSLTLDSHSAITKNHHIDCTNAITIGKFSTVAGYGSQLLTHSIDIYECRQDSKPITIGDYCFVSTNVVILGGAVLPSYSVLGAKSLLNKDYQESYTLYGGVPAKAISTLPLDAKYFLRKEGFVF